MTFKIAVEALDNSGEYGAKRPSMRGYVFKEAACVAEGEPLAEAKPHLVAADGTRKELGTDEMMLTKELLNALVFADDWELAPRVELEKARSGEGTM